MNANTSTLTPAAGAATQLTAVALCRLKDGVPVRVFEPETSTPRYVQRRNWRNDLEWHTVHAGFTLPFQLDSMVVDVVRVQPAAEAFDRMVRARGKLGIAQDTLTLRAPVITPMDAKSSGMAVDDLPQTLDVPVTLIAPKTRLADLLEQLDDLMTAHVARATFLAAWHTAQRRGLKQPLPGMEVRGWILPHYDGMVLFDDSMIKKIRDIFKLEEALPA
ncbi:MAG: hypothetical protein DI585_00555 [Pseudomonas fluorescens]|nr:MAG: hypothetical protein DI585_00555 [Pseudomonas fluorescens]